ncbi:hypothetical protein H112_08082 [Trichophyton rubrum D6]|uniref:Uncharacterized protein n=3 Tax=Trichophyton rubrum TaxID=5551 RepID=A0A178ET96_TRIRU|nr:uncharacterized protein TERG_00657 [Trichophyton rubrum CBS 118892]EZF10631.1 hypothetical protein H100_08110 [Trichophyton rubrum MR850]EZF37556.1 hypothetical protein H102_08066 [Trichophyton rubrum CBS 100081]EZF48163.1 hypothetical protein H103_08093 [Trichophyton rubrum CBS 288.86]EZF58826.1 hypothetical protein H104_08040 [Trichophyton rubrum CBS 289.86]EZF80071.1 hypothetical protein H110_08094 [Trichophyton rubrum MR1448]EZF90749.1 hypothetical protein H113_08156 [Trichophyton rubr
MNRFRNRKKRGDGPDPSDAPPVPIFSKQFFKKKPEPEQPPKIDLSTALPTDNDFRTSLLMPNLSARFSMLREQDDPNSKIGKANDDSVLFPKRASRLNLFANSQLADITEVGSLHGSDRPSLNIGRSSYASGSTDDDCHTPSSIMTRSRPVEGNTLFGGRQKVYKIPNTRCEPASENEGGSEGGARSPTMGGKQLYQNDIGSIFQQSKGDDDSKSEPDLRPESTALMSLPSNRQAEPSSFFVSENRNSASTTSANSQGPTSRQGSVTAKTSTRSTQNSAGAGLERNSTKSRRLYDRGLELQNQPSALSRLESISRQRAIASDNGLIKRSLSKSAVNLNERYQKLSPVYSSSSFRPTSPPPSSTSSVVGNSEPKRLSPVSTTNSTPGLAMGSPLSPPASETEEGSAFAAAIQPEDRGKATATGLFNKPLSKYDESQFSQRQIQIHENRSNASLQRPSLPRGGSDVTDSRRQRDLSIISHQSKPESPGLSTSQNSPLSTPHCIDLRPTPVQSEKPRLPINPSTFLADFSGSDSGSEAEEDVSNARVSPLFHPHENVGSPLRVSMESGDSVTPVSSSTKPSHPALGEFYSESRDLNTIKEDEPVADPVPIVQEPPQQIESESPVLGPTGLSSLIRAHLRQDSDKSTIYPPSSPISMDRPSENPHPNNPQVHGTRSSDLAVSIHSNPWEYDDWARPTYHPAEPAERFSQPESDFSSMSLRAKQMLGQATALSNQGNEKEKNINTENQEERAPATPVPTAPKPSANASQPSWEEDIKFGHRRGGSTETQMEREEFANELAERRRKVQEKLKNFAENESRSTSPASSYRFPDNGNSTQTPSKTGNAFAILKAKTSRNQNNQSKQDHPLAKSSKLLGLDKPQFNSSAPNLQQSNDMWREEDERMRRLVRKSRAESPMGGNRQIGWGRQPQPPQSTTPQSRQSEEDTRNSTRDSASSTWRSGPRDRSDSDTSGRSKSRPRYREDLGAVRESAEQPRMGRPSIEDKASRSSSSRPSMESTDRRTRDRSASTGRYRSNSRSVPPNYIDLQSLPGPSPTLQHPAIAHSSRPSPSPNPHPYSANATPPILENSSTSSTPAAGGYGGPPMQYPLPQRNPPVSGSVATQQSLGSHKRVVDKSQISEPTFVSTTSNVPTIGLPAGASLANGAPTPPIPPMNPRRRRQTTTHNILGAFKGSSPSDRPDQYPHHGPKHHNQNHPNSSRRSEEHSTFSDDEKRPRARQRLRKISSEGGNLNAKARHHLMNGNQPALPPPPRHNRVEGLL